MNIEGIEDVSKLVRTLLWKVSPEIVSAAESFASQVLYVPVSATGRGPETDPRYGRFRFPAQGHETDLGRSAHALHFESLDAGLVPYVKPGISSKSDGNTLAPAARPCAAAQGRRWQGWKQREPGIVAMSQELIYTSAPRGLKPGSQGFCTVVSTQGISASLVQRLEALSGYRHVFPPQDPNARLNPVLFSHLIFSLAGRRCHVLSRVCDAGLDHTQRTNKFAHHVVLDPRELVPGGPAWLACRARVHAIDLGWRAQGLAGRPSATAANSPAAICRAWQQITGDAGWGGALAETASPGASRLAVIIFRPGIDPLPLLAESLALLSPESRWNVSFCTYFNKLPPGLECQWRCVLEGSPEAIANQRLPGALVIDLGKPTGAAAAECDGRGGANRRGAACACRGSAAASRCRCLPAQRRGTCPVIERICPGPAVGVTHIQFIAKFNCSSGDGGDFWGRSLGFGPASAATERDGPAASSRAAKVQAKAEVEMADYRRRGGIAVILLLGIGAMQIANIKRTTTPVVSAPSEQEKPTPSKSSADAQKLVDEANLPRHDAKTPEADFENSVKELERKAVAAAEAARSAASNASDATERAKKLAHWLDLATADIEVENAAKEANRAKARRKTPQSLQQR